MPLALFGTVLTDGRELERCRVVVEGGRIAAVEAGTAPRAGDVVVEDGFVAPGLIDLHVHGSGGVDLTSAEDPHAAVASVARALARHGVTSFCPSFVSAAPAVYERSLAAFGPRPHPAGAESLGAHLEGPFLDPERRGIHEATALRHPSAVEIARWLALGPPALVTLAPELPGAIDAIRQLSAAGVAVSLGHSSADAEVARDALAAGARHGTHLFNAMPPLHHRRPGLAGALLVSQATLELIADGVHVDPIVVDIVFRAVGAGRVTLVTDGLAATGTAPGPSRVGDTPLAFDGHSVRRADGTLAGTAVTLDECVRNVARWFPSLPPAAVVRTATAAPAATLGPLAASRKGSVAPGYDADVVVFDGAWNVRATYVRGEAVR